MKRISLAALAVLAVLFAPVAASAGTTSQYFHPKSPLRYIEQRYSFSTTASISSAYVGVLPARAVLKAVIVSQFAAGEGGTSWVAIPKVGANELTTTDGGFTLAAGADKVTTNLTNPISALTAPTGATRPTLTAANVSQAAGAIVQIDVTLTGTYTTAVSGEIILLWEPKD